MMEERVVREAVVDGGRVDGLGREGEAGIRIRRWAASVRGARRERRVVGMCILAESVRMKALRSLCRDRGGCRWIWSFQSLSDTLA